MFTKETLNSIANVLRISPDDFIAKATSEEEVTLDSIPVKLHTPDELTQFGQNRFSEGKNAMSEITVKELRQKFPDVKYQGKQMDGFLDAFSAWKVEQAGIDPNKQIETLQAEKSSLQQKLESDAQTFQGKIKELESNMFKSSMSMQVATHFPKESALNNDDLLTLFNAKYNPMKQEDGSIVWHKGNEPLKDELQNPIKTENVVKMFIDEGKYIPQAGMGGGDQGSGFTGKFEKFSQFEQWAKDNNKEPMGEDALKYLTDNKAENFDMNS